MKRKISLLFIGALAFLVLPGCSSDKHEGSEPISPPPSTGVNTVVEMKLSDAGIMMRAAGEGEEPATPDEKQITGDITVLIYNASDGKLELELSEELNSDKKVKFTIKSGRKYIYVIANQNVGEPDPGVEVMSNRIDFEKQILDVAFSGSGGKIPSITDPNFFIGTLWGTEVQVAPGGTDKEPIKLTVKVGRTAAKAKLHKVEKGVNSNRPGEFTEPYYRIGSVPKTYYQVGQYIGNTPPPEEGHGKVISAVHEEDWGYIDDSNPDEPVYMQNEAFTNYTAWSTVTNLPEDPLDNFFYIVENTTAQDKYGDQYYGNSTYIQLRTKYIPASGEMVSIDDLESPGTPQGDDFWIIVIGDNKYLVDNYDPENPGMPEVKEYYYYKEGLNYHKFPIRDKAETDPEKMNAVLRNHYYEIAVNAIKDLGSPDEEVDPSEPLVSETEVEITIEVIDWSKITQEEEL